MFIGSYLRASTAEQVASRAHDALGLFVSEYGHAIACKYVESESGARADRPELLRLLKDARKGDALRRSDSLRVCGSGLRTR